MSTYHNDDDYEGPPKPPRRAEVPGWFRLEGPFEREGGYWRVDGRDVHCGDGLELQARAEDQSPEARAYARETGNVLEIGLDRGIRVRFEIDWSGGRRTPILYLFFEGHIFTARAESWMRFRWPRKE